MMIDPDFIPCEANEGDEIYSLGIFNFNISRMLSDIESGSLIVVRESINVQDWFRNHCECSVNEEHMPNVKLSSPVIQAEIKHERFEIIDGNHRMIKALREGIPFVDSYRIAGHQLPSYLIERRGYEAYIQYWNDKLP